MASKNIVAKGTTYNGVESVTFPVSGGGNATFYEISDTTAGASDVLNSKYFYTAAGVKTQGTGTAPSPTLITKNITQNGTYDAEDDDADGYSSVTVSVSGGGGDSWSWMGRNPVKLQEWTEHTSFADLGVDNWTWGTSNTSLRTAQNLSPDMSCDCENYDYIQVVKCRVTYDYGNWTPNSTMKQYALYSPYIVYAICNTYAAAVAETPNTVTYATGNSDYQAYYAGPSGDGFGAFQYGVYSASAVSPTVGSGSSLTRTVTWRKPIIYARGNNSYFTSTALANLDTSKSYYDSVVEVWRVDAGTCDRGNSAVSSINILNNGL